jgi:hypothetical protein
LARSHLPCLCFQWAQRNWNSASSTPQSKPCRRPYGQPCLGPRRGQRQPLYRRMSWKRLPPEPVTITFLCRGSDRLELAPLRRHR